MEKSALRNIIIVNMITGIRALGAILLIPIYLFYGYFWTGIAVLFFFSTDWIDGLLARKWQCSTIFGAIFDGMSDKLFALVALILLSLKNIFFILPIIMEIIILFVGYNSAFKGNNVASSFIGKVKTVILGLTLIFSFILINNQNNLFLVNLLLLILVIFELLTIYNYVQKDLKYTKENDLYNNKMQGNKNIIAQIKARKMLLNELVNSLNNKNKKSLLFDHQYYLKYRDISIKDLKDK